MVLGLPVSWSNWNLEMLVFEGREKPEYPEKNLSEQGREQTTNSTHIWRRRRDLNPGHICGRRVLSPLHQVSSRTLRMRSCSTQRVSGCLQEFNHRGALPRGGPRTSFLLKLLYNYCIQFLSYAMCSAMLLLQFFVYST